ncbi:MAG: anthranilate synthase component I family protein [Bacteroidota bacterium]
MTINLSDPTGFKSRALRWARQFERICLLDSNNDLQYAYQSTDFLLAVGAQAELLHYVDARIGEDGFSRLRQFCEEKRGWLFGFLGYDLKNELEDLSSSNPDGIGLPDLHFFRPELVLEVKGASLTIHGASPLAKAAYKELLLSNSLHEEAVPPQAIDIQARISHQDYLDTIQQIRQHIRKGDIYEMNFCQEFYATDCHLSPFSLFDSLNSLSRAPFAGFYRLGDRYLACASPERFLKKVGTKLISQPIKGTIRRGQSDWEDRQLAAKLSSSAKDRSENVMIVDLVRNDLARSCRAGSVKVEELFHVYPFEHVFQMISTVSGELKEGVHFIDAIRRAFPMGSMTGAPKVRSMQLIEQYEQSRRGLYSGAVGYIRPNGDFDFNVVIRSILYNAADCYLSFQAGGAIVFDSVAEQEYRESLLKAEALRAVLEKPAISKLHLLPK